MDVSRVCGQLKTNLLVAFETCLADSGHDALTLPSVLDYVVNEFGNCNCAGSILGQERTALGVIAGFDVLSKSIDVLFRISDFHISHCSFLLYYCFFDCFTFTVDNGFGCRLLCGSLFEDLSLPLFEHCNFALKGFEVSVLGHFCAQFCGAGFHPIEVERKDLVSTHILLSLSFSSSNFAFRSSAACLSARSSSTNPSE